MWDQIPDILKETFRRFSSGKVLQNCLPVTRPYYNDYTFFFYTPTPRLRLMEENGEYEQEVDIAAHIDYMAGIDLFANESTWSMDEKRQSHHVFLQVDCTQWMRLADEEGACNEQWLMDTRHMLQDLRQDFWEWVKTNVTSSSQILCLLMSERSSFMMGVVQDSETGQRHLLQIFFHL